MSKDSKDTIIEKLTENILKTRFEDFDGATVDNAKHRIIDVLGCAIGGAYAGGNLGLLRLIREWGGREEATILVHGGKVPAHNAAMINSIMARSFDFEALIPLIDGIQTPAHISGTTVMTAIAMGELYDLNGRELITALLVGDDVAIRILGASGFWFNLGWDNTGTINALGATATAGKILGLNKLQLRNAFGIVLNQLAGSAQNCWDGSMTFKLPQGLSARNGIFSAQLAKEEWNGPEDALLSECGYYKVYTEGCKNPESLTKDLGKKYYSESVFKPYPACRATHAAVECALTILIKNNIKAQDIESAVLYVPIQVLEGFMGQPFKVGEFPHGNAVFNFRYMTASALLRGSAKPEHFSEESIKDPDINLLIKRIRMAELPSAPTLSAKLEIRMKNGRQYSEYIDTPKGDPTHNPMTKEEIKDKFRNNVNFTRTVSKENAEEILLLLENLEEIKNIREIINLINW